MEGKFSGQEFRKALSNRHDLDALRCSPLADRMPPSYLRAAGGDRGLALQQFLDDALEQLKLVETEQANSRARRLYRALRYRYVEGLSPQEVQARLFISKSELYRTLEKAVAEILDFWQRAKRGPQNITDWGAIPRLELFVGRQKELADFYHRLTTQHFVIIRGMAGVGKTSLGAELVNRLDAENVLWIRFSPGRNTDLEALLENLALSLAVRGQEAAWLFLQAERQKPQPLSPHTQARYLIGCLEDATCTLCLDDFHLVDHNAAIASFCTDLLRGAQQKRLDLVIMSRTVPGFARDWAFPPLGGLSPTEAHDLLENKGLGSLSEHALSRLYERTAGVPIFLTLFAALVRSRGLSLPEDKAQITALVEQVEREVEVQDYLLHEVAMALSPDEAWLLLYASALRTAFDAEDDELCMLLEGSGVGDVANTALALVRKHLATLQSDGTLAFHPMVATFFYRCLRGRPTDKVQVHRQLARYHEARQEWLEAAHHSFEVGEYEQAAQLLSGNVTWLISTGQAEATLKQLEQLTPRLARFAGPELRFEAAAAREALCHLLGQREKQKSVLDTMLALAEELGDERRLAMAHNRRAQSQEATGDYPASLQSAKSGLQTARRAGDKSAEAQSLILLGRALSRRGEHAAAREQIERARTQARAAGDKRTEADSLNNLATICQKTADYAAAREYSKQGLALLRALGDRQGEANGLHNLANIYYGLGDHASSRAYNEQALAIRQALNDRRGEAGSLNNLGVVCRELGDYPAAQAYWEQVLALARAIGDPQSEAASLGNLGLMCDDLGDYPAARAYSEQALALARAIGDQQFEGLSLGNLGRVCGSLGEYAAAQTYLEQALALTRAIGDPQNEVISLTNLGIVYGDLGDYTAARMYGEQALALAQTIGDQRTAGYILNYLGMALEHLGDLDGAEAAYREGLTIRRQTSQPAQAIDSIAGLGRVALARKQGAKQYAEECLAYIAAHGVAGIEYMFKVYLTCVDILEACGERERAQVVLEEAHTLLMERADRIDDEALRRSFLENVPTHHALREAWKRKWESQHS